MVQKWSAQSKHASTHFSTEWFHNVPESSDEGLHAFHFVTGQGFKLLNGAEHVNQFNHTAAEQVKFAKNLSLAEVKLLPFWHGE